MGFNSVYKVLQEVFPQVDSRVLKAVAIEHSKDADLAVDVVLVEIIPHLPEKQSTVGSSSINKSSLSFVEVGETSQLESTMEPLVINPYQHEHSTEARVVSNIDGGVPGATEALDTGFSAQVNSHTVIKPVNLESFATSSDYDANGEAVSESSRFVDTIGDKNINIHDSGSSDNYGQGPVKVGCENVDDETFNVTVSNQLVGSYETILDATQELNSSSSKSVFENDAFTVKSVNSDDESGMNSVLTRSQENCNTEFLEEIIEEAKNDKKILVEAMSSVGDLMREVEYKEKDADQAKLEATRGCSDILAKVDEVKQALLRAKEANDMHAGEVNAEKAILATEFKELQLRLFTLSDERNKSLGILDEMRKALEIRLAAALDEIATAEEQKIENERAAREALLYQEKQMEKVVEESKRLKQEAEENSKLQEFLMDRGHAIDILQGEISVKCQDVLLLKEKFDKGIPLSRSLSSSRASSILASSSSSVRSVFKLVDSEPEPETEPKAYESLMKSVEMSDSFDFLDKSLRSEVAPQSPKVPEETVKPIDHHKVLIEDDWEIFEK